VPRADAIARGDPDDHHGGGEIERAIERRRKCAHAPPEIARIEGPPHEERARPGGERPGAGAADERGDEYRGVVKYGRADIGGELRKSEVREYRKADACKRKEVGARRGGRQAFTSRAAHRLAQSLQIHPLVSGASCGIVCEPRLPANGGN